MGTIFCTFTGVFLWSISEEMRSDSPYAYGFMLLSSEDVELMYARVASKGNRDMPLTPTKRRHPAPGKKNKNEPEKCQGHSATPYTVAAINATHPFRGVSANCGFLADESVEGGARVLLPGGRVGAFEDEPGDVGALFFWQG